MSPSETNWGVNWKRLIIVIVVLLILVVLGQKKNNTGPTAPSPEETAAKAQREPENAAQKVQREAEEAARCAADLKCFGDKNLVAASFACRPKIERLAKNDFEWTDAWYEAKLSHFRWKDQEHRIVTYIGDKIKFQNAFGAWQRHIYECDYAPETKTVFEVRANPGQLPN
jgi:hypothetical protein